MKKLVCFLLVAISLCISASTFAKENTVTHHSCIVYLPLTEKVTSWGTWRQDFVEKGYSPVEFDVSRTENIVQTGDLIAALHYNLRTDTTWLGTNKQICTVELELSKLITLKPSPLAAVLYTAKDSETTLLGDEFDCKSAEANVLADLPTCNKQ